MWLSWSSFALTLVHTYDCRPGAATLATKIGWPNPMHFFSYGDMLKDSVFLLPLQDLPEQWRCIIAVTSEIDHGLLQWVWGERDCRLDICQVAKGEHRTLMSFKKHWRVSLSISRSHLTILSPIQVYLFYEMCQGLVNKSVYFITLNMSKTVIFKITNHYFLCIKNYKHRNYWNSEVI